MPLKLNVPYSEKDSAKNKGAYWDKNEKTWFVPDNKDINSFIKWIDTEKFDTIIKTPFYIAINKRLCWKCGEETTVISLYSDNFLSLDYDNEDSDILKFDKLCNKSFFSNVTYLDKSIANFIKQNFPFYKVGYSKTIQDKYWANHCEKCNSLQGDFFNYSEPGGPFYPVTMEEYQNLLLIQVKFKYDLTIKGGFSYMSNEDEIFEFAQKKFWIEN